MHLVIRLNLSGSAIKEGDDGGTLEIGRVLREVAATIEEMPAYYIAPGRSWPCFDMNRQDVGFVSIRANDQDPT
jgi:hypothetical protein